MTARSCAYRGDPTTLYKLAAPSTPDAAIEEIQERLETGERISVAYVQTVIKRAKERTKQQAPGTVTIEDEVLSTDGVSREERHRRAKGQRIEQVLTLMLRQLDMPLLDDWHQLFDDEELHRLRKETAKLQQKLIALFEVRQAGQTRVCKSDIMSDLHTSVSSPMVADHQRRRHSGCSPSPHHITPCYSDRRATFLEYLPLSSELAAFHHKIESLGLKTKFGDLGISNVSMRNKRTTRTVTWVKISGFTGQLHLYSPAALCLVTCCYTDPIHANHSTHAYKAKG